MDGSYFVYSSANSQLRVVWCALDGARHEMGQMSYAVPVDSLSGEIVLRHLLRFSQKGQFALPPARFHRMYQPAQQAFEVEPALQHIDVR